jgi:AcrR family transcriptional regulator
MQKIDGRVLRAQRTRKSLITAFQRFAAEGILDPVVRELARRAGVSMRSIYQHFGSVSALREAALTDEQWCAAATRLRALSDRELVEATLRRDLRA